MDKEGMKFLDKIFKDLYKEDSVSRYKSNKYQNIDSYMKKFERLSSGNHKKLLIKILVDNYVIKEENIPYGKDKNQIISSQRSSLEDWLYYLTDDTCSYPMWIKYYVFRSLIKIGTKSEIDKTYQVRSKKTLSPFIEFNAEALAYTVESIMKNVYGESLNDQDVLKLVNTGSFKKIYIFYLEKLSKKAKTYGNDGIWVKYNQGTDDYIKLSESLKGFNTGWCTASLDVARRQICGDYCDAPNGGDFYVYYSIDENGLYKIPRIAIRMKDHDKICEIRGIDDGQNLEGGLENILESKLNEMPFLSMKDKDNSLNKVNNSKHISDIISKNYRGEVLSIDEIRIIYGIKECKTFGWTVDPRLKKIRKVRNHQADFDRLESDDKVTLLVNSVALNVLCDDEEILLKAMMRNGRTLQYADKNVSNYEGLVMKVVKYDGNILQYVDNSAISNYEEFALAAVKENGRAIEYVDKSSILNYEKLALITVKQYGDAIEYVDKSLVSNYEELALAAVKQNGDSIRYVDKSAISNYEELVLAAVKQNGFAMRYVDKSLVSNYGELALAAVKQNGAAVRCVDKSLIKNKMKFYLMLAFSTTVDKIKHVVTFISDKFINICGRLSLKRTGGVSKETTVTIGENKDIKRR